MTFTQAHALFDELAGTGVRVAYVQAREDKRYAYEIVCFTDDGQLIFVQGKRDIASLPANAYEITKERV